MASQVENRGQETVSQARRPGRIDTSGRLLPTNPREDVRTQPHLLTRPELDALNKNLLAAGQTIETTRQKLYETRFVADSTLQELEQERHIRQQCSDAYKEAHVQYAKKSGELHEMVTKCMSLNAELEQSQMKLSDYESTFENFEKSIASGKVQLENAGKEIEWRTSQLHIAMKRIHELEGEVKQAVAGERVAREHFSELEEERAQLKLALQRYDGLEQERGQLGMALQKIHNLEQEAEHAEGRHLAKVNEIATLEALAGQRIAEQRQEIEELVQELQVATGITVDQPCSAEGRPGTKRAANPARGRSSRYRKCKDARKVVTEDAVTVVR